MPEFKEYDCVETVRQIGKIPLSTVGTILIVFENEYYEVEFINEYGETLEVLTVSKNDLICSDDNHLSKYSR